jgi:class 3 adenylate cyclase
MTETRKLAAMLVADIVGYSRVGIHVGDVVEESDRDLMSDGVKIAARLA